MGPGNVYTQFDPWGNSAMLTAIAKHEAAIAALNKHKTVRAAALSLGIPPSTFQNWQKPVVAGNLRASQREVRPLPRKGTTKVYILTSAQNNTGLHEACWLSLNTAAQYDGAEIIAARVTYATNSRASAGQKNRSNNTDKKTSREPHSAIETWDLRLEPYFCDHSVELAPGLVWCGELQILPTAVDPISGLESYTGRASSIIPHAKFAVRSIASPKLSGTKFIYTTGTVTLRNYIQKKTGQKASFHHGYGAVIVEVCADGSWFVRQLNADSEGVIYDLDRKFDGEKVTIGNRPEALVWGDIHTRQLEDDMRALCWGKGGILDTLRPRRQVMHDVLDFRSANHHDRKDPWRTYAKHVTKTTCVADEVAEVATFLKDASRDWCETAVAAANHDEALVRWLKEVDYREDHENAEFILEATAEAYRAMRLQDKEFYPVEWAVNRTADGPSVNVKWLRRDEEYTVCEDAHGGIELSNHGDKGTNGARGGIRDFARSGRKCIIGHSHSAGLHEGAMQVGVMGSLDMDYNVGMSSWSHSAAIVYPNGKRTLITVWRGRYRGQNNQPKRNAA